MKSIYIIVVLFALVYVMCPTAKCLATTYYVDATNGKDSNKGTVQAAPWRTIAKVNNSHFQPGDSILFNRGKIWREKLSVHESGLSGQPITFASYGTGTDPVIFSNGIQLKPNNGNYSTLGSNEWDWHSNYLYVNVGGIDPDDVTLEAGQRDWCIFVAGGDGKDYIVIDGLTLLYGNKWGIYAGNDADYLIVRNCLIKQQSREGVLVEDGDYAEVYDNTIISGSPNFYSHYGSIHFEGNHGKMYRNDCSYSEVGPVWWYDVVDGADITSGEAYENVVHDMNCNGCDKHIDADLQGITAVGKVGHQTTGISIYRNLVYDCAGCGIGLWNSSNDKVYSQGKVLWRRPRRWHSALGRFC
jgi:hypothetical protein